jgi:hypothetical protein
LIRGHSSGEGVCELKTSCGQCSHPEFSGNDCNAEAKAEARGQFEVEQVRKNSLSCPSLQMHHAGASIRHFDTFGQRTAVNATAACGQKGVDEIVIFSVGSRSAVSIPCEENFTLAKNLPLHGTKPGSSLRSVEELPGRSPSGEAFRSAGTAGGQPASGAQIGFWVIRLFSARRSGVLSGPLTEPATQGVAQVSKPAVSPTSKSAGRGNEVGLTLDPFQQGSWVLRSGVQRITLQP